MRVSRELKGFLIAGAAVGLLGVALFGLVHALIIVPIWTRLFGGVPFGIVGGLAMGWAFHELRSAGRVVSAPSTFAFGLILWLSLVPMTTFGAVLRVTGIHGTDDSWELAVELLLAFGAGALAGRLLGRHWRPALAVGVATVALALVMGGPIPVSNSPRAAWLFAAFGVMYPLCSVLLGALAGALGKVLEHG